LSRAARRFARRRWARRQSDSDDGTGSGAAVFLVVARRLFRAKRFAYDGCMAFDRYDRVRLTEDYEGMPAGLEGIATGQEQAGRLELVQMEGYGMKEIPVQFLQFVRKGEPG
jgi:hypothetical protein